MPDYLKRQLIAYLGNKRALLPFLENLFSTLTDGKPGVFLDPFAGSGSVSRLARTLGFEVHANDWEPYALVMNRAYLTQTPGSIEKEFSSAGGLTRVLAELNQLQRPRGPEFLARYYAPHETESADWRTERLFYTRENALWLDAVRESIDEKWPLVGPQRDMLLALLIYEASVHSNTSGVFKAYHKGFGGHGGDALTRIKAPMQLENPELWDSPRKASATSLDAPDFLRLHRADVIYLDPPYNQHQYGSNYHLLNTVALGDRFEPVAKAGIRQDWIRTKSRFCSKATAEDALKEVLDAADARHLVMSYNTEGVIPFEVLYDALDRRGKVSLAVQDYVTYRGGRQSPERRTHNLEFCLVVDTRQAPRTGNRQKVDDFLTEKKLANLLKTAFHPERLRQAFPGEGSTLQWGDLIVDTDQLHRIPHPPNLSQIPAPIQAHATRGLLSAQCQCHQEEFTVLARLWLATPSGTARNRKTRRLALVLRKFAFRQYADDFEKAFAQAWTMANEQQDSLLMSLLEDLRKVADRRLGVR